MLQGTYGDTKFPTGQAFHMRPGYMKQLIAGKLDPYVFHMNWTGNKTLKIQYLQQLGEWYLKDTCVINVIGKPKEISDRKQLTAACCSKEALFECHFRDKPSIRDCSDSPSYTQNGKSFW